MRKVTASAVILTALTGCSQSSGIPSAQWSFELPSGDKAQAKATDAENLPDVELSADAQSFLGGTFGKNVMGPAFEQPIVGGVASNAPVGSRVSSIGRPGSQEISRIALETAAITSATSSRPDPVDQVRSYLRSSGRPSALANRTPYASQVYLSTVPVSNPADVSNFPIALAPGNSPSSGAAPAIAFESGAGNAFTSSSAANTGFAQAGFNQDYSADLGFVGTQAAYGDVAYPSSVGEATVASPTLIPATGTPVAIAPAPLAPTEEAPALTSTITTDGLPQLVPAQPSDLAFLRQAPQAAPPIEEENLSIGTSILRDLQRSSQATVAANTADTAPLELGSASSEVSSFSRDASISLVPTSADEAPTLASLRQTMPQRELSPLVVARQASVAPTPSLQLEFPSRSAVDGVDLEALNIEGINALDAQITSPAINAVFESTPVEPTTAIEADLHSSSDSYSPLLEGLRTTESASTIYVPIADEVSSSDLIQNAVMALGQEASTAALLEDIAFKNAFSSVLTSAALLSGESTANQAPGEMIAHNPLLSEAAQAGVIEIITEETNPSQAIKSFGSDADMSRLSVLQQGVLKRSEVKRRQLITWR